MAVSEVIERLQRQALDVVVEVGLKRRVYRGVRHTDRERFRLVGVRDPVSGAYHLYLTNIPPERLMPMDIAKIYAARSIGSRRVCVIFGRCERTGSCPEDPRKKNRRRGRAHRRRPENRGRSPASSSVQAVAS